MSSNGAFVLSAGLLLSLEGDELSIENTGDIVIETPPPQPLGRLISSDGDVVLTQQGGIKLKTIHAPQGRVTLSGKIEVESVFAREIVFFSGKIKSSVLKATESIALGGSRVEANVVVAPLVTIAGSLKGRSTAISAGNDLGPHHLKGGFSLREFVDLVPNGRALLDAHDIEVPDWDDEDEDDDDVELESIDSLEQIEEAESKRVKAAKKMPVDDDGDKSDDDGSEVDPIGVSPGPPPAIADTNLDEDEDVSIAVQAEDDDISIAVQIDDEGEDGLTSKRERTPDNSNEDSGADQSVESAAPSIPQEWEASVATIRGALEEIRASYDGEPPPPVSELATLAHDGDLTKLKARINGIWSSLLKHHQRTKAYIPNTVTHMFQQIQMELRKV